MSKDTIVPDDRDTIVPDDKDWTWVLAQACPECGLDSATMSGAEVTAVLPGLVADWERVLARPREQVVARPLPSVWSPLEYACHVRDVFRVFDERLALMLAQDGPTFANWDQDATAVEEDYAAQDPSVVRAELSGAGARLWRRFGTVQGEQWERPGYRSNGSAFTVESLARYFVHDVVHHLRDVA